MLFRENKFRPCRDAERWYDDCNKKYFGGKCPVVRIGFYDKKAMKNSYAWTVRKEGFKFPSHIVFNPYFYDWVDELKRSLLHEMCHVYLPQGVHHGPKFKKELRRLLLAGAFDN